VPDAGGKGVAEDGIVNKTRRTARQWLCHREALAGAESGAEVFFHSTDDTSGEVVNLGFGQRGFAALENDAHEE
jgi:hypothetical protein